MQTIDNRRRKKQMFLDMQEHPEKYSDEQIETLMDELDQMPETETAWQKFTQDRLHVAERSTHRWMKIAASTVGVIIISGIAIAAIHIWRLTPNPSPKGEENSYIQSSDTIKHSTPLSNQIGVEGEATITFDNVPLDTMLMEMADYYHVTVDFQRDDIRQLRLHFEWKHNESLDKVVERLNIFEAVNIIHEPEKLIVK